MSGTRARSGPRTLLAIAASLGLLVALAIPATATHVEPTLIEGSGNSSCGELGDYAFEFKVNIENPDGTFEQGDPGVTVDPNEPPTDFEVTIDFDGTDNTIDFTANYLVEAVFLKGGANGSHLYEYSPGVLSDEGLHVPGNSDISHVSFCYQTRPEETPTPTPTPSPTETASPTPTPTEAETASPTPTPTESQAEEEETPTPTPTPREDTQGGNPTPTPGGGTIPDTAMGGLTQVPATVLSLVMLAALAATAYARLARQR